MKLKALTIGLALSFPMMVSAQSSTSVTLYGTIDTAIEYVNNIGPDKDSSVHFTNLTQSWPSHWGLRGSEDLGNGLSAVFALESGFNAGTGTQGQGGRLFGRQAWVGLKGDWGQVAFGRQYNMLFWSLLGSDIMGPNAYGLGTLDNYIPNARMDNSITYRGNFDGFKFGAAWARGRDTVAAGGPAARGCGVDYTSNSACGAYSFMLGYDTANWGVAGAYDVIKGADTTFPAAAGGLPGVGDKDTRWNLNGYMKFDDLKVSLIYLNRKWDAPSLGASQRIDTWALGASYQFTPQFALDGSVYYVNVKNTSPSARAWYYVARARYNLSKRTSVYASAAFMNNKNTGLSAAGGTAPQPGVADPSTNQTAFMVGLRHNF